MTLRFGFNFTVSPGMFEVLTHLWQSTVVAVVILLLLALGRRLAPRTRRALGWIALFKFALPAAWLSKIVEQLGGAPRSWLAADALLVPGTFPTNPAPISAFAEVPITLLLSILWGAGAVTLMVGWARRAQRARARIFAAAAPVPAWLSRRVANAAMRTGLRRPPRCAMVAAEHGPGLVGVLRPVLILPRGLAEALSARELDAILIHECLHQKSQDNVWNAVRAALVGLLWFNPIVWLLNRSIGTETEKACDARVLEITEDATTYANSIVATVRHNLGIVQPGFAGATTPPVVSRLQAVLAYPTRRERPWARRVVLLASVALVAFSGRSGSVAADASASPSSPSPVATSIAAPGGAQPAVPEPVRYKIRAITITFLGPVAISEEAVRSTMQMRAGGEFDEVTLDRDIRALYRTGLFKFIEVKHKPVDGTTFDLSVELTAKSPAGALNQQSVTPASPPPGALEVRPVYEIAQLDRTPVLRFQARPQYPAALRKAGVAGEVIVDFIVNEQGDVVNAVAARASRVEFETAALEAVSRWRFRPGARNGVDVSTHLQMPIIFTLNAP